MVRHDRRSVSTLKVSARLFFLLALAALVLGGCQGFSRYQGEGPYPRTYQTYDPSEEKDLSIPAVPIRQMAYNLGMAVEQTTENRVTLANAANRVDIFTHRDGNCYVNGVSIGPAGIVSRAGDDIFVPKSLEQTIRSSLQESSPLPPPLKRSWKGHTIVIDPGHGGRDPGATSCIGFYEKTINMAVAAELARALRQKGWNVILTRQSDRYVDLNERADLANRRKADLYVSIHADSCPNRAAQGLTLYVARSASRESMQLSRSIERALKSEGIDCRGMRRADYRVLVRTKCPAVLVELGYLSNFSEARSLKSLYYQKRLARAISNGIHNL